MADLTLALEVPADDPSDLAREVESARAGEAAAFEAIVRRYERMVLTTALRLLGSVEDAQDASQEVFLRLYRSLGSVRLDNFAGWLYRVTVNVSHDQLRRRRPEVALEEAALHSAGEDALAAMTAEERQRALAVVLERLPPKERAALVLHDLEGLATAEVARILGSSEATVRSQVSQARIKLRQAMRRYMGRHV